MKIKLIIFDLDGVLIKAKEIHFSAFNYALFEVGCKHGFNDLFVLSWDEHLSIYDGLKTYEKLNLISKNKGLPTILHNEVWTLKQKKTIELLESLKESPEFIDCLSRLDKEGYKLAVCSNSIKDTVNTVLTEMGIIYFFHPILSNQDVKNSKPHPEIYWQAMSTLSILPEETIIIEDSPPGLLGASRSGARVMRVQSPDDVTYENITNFIKNMKSNLKPKWTDNKLNVLIPMAGAGTRFEKAGYSFPKPLIDVQGQTMIQVVVDSLGIDANYIYIVQKSHREKYNLDSLLSLITPNCKVIEVDGITEGAACTALKAKELIDNDNPLFFANSDQYVDWNSSEFMYKMQETDVDGGIVTFESNHPKWSFAKLDEKGFVSEVAEKNPISNLATCFSYNTCISVNGKSIQIGKVVNNKINGFVSSYNAKTKKIEFKKIINWIKKDGTQSEWFDLSYEDAVNSKAGKLKNIRVTGDHKILTDKGYVRVDEITDEKILTKFKKPNDKQKELITGCLLGDGFIKKTGNGELGRFCMKHGLIQEAWIDLKAEFLQDLKIIKTQIEPSRQSVILGRRVNNSGSKLVAFSTNPYWRLLLKEWYRDGKKIVPKTIVLSPLVLATWYLDDGSLKSGKNGCVFCTDSFDDSSISTLREKLLELNIQTSLDSRRRICVNDGAGKTKHYSFSNLMKMIESYIMPEMEYKIPDRNKGKFDVENFSLQEAENFYSKPIITKVNLDLLNCRELNDIRYSYCITVEDNHNFLVNDVVVSNCGYYYWKHGSDFIKYAEQMINKNIRVNNEFYVCPVFNQAIEDGKKILTFNIDKMWGLGTPEDLNYYLENHKK